MSNSDDDPQGQEDERREISDSSSAEVVDDMIVQEPAQSSEDLKNRNHSNLPSKKQTSAIVDVVEPKVSRGNFVVYTAIFALTFVCYGNGLHGQFAYDDNYAIISNTDVLGTTHWSSLFRNDFWGHPMYLEDSNKSYRPLTVLSFRFNHLLAGSSPAWFRVVNILLHACVSSLVFCLGRMQFSRTSTLGYWVSFWASIFFVVHPIHTEAVTSIVGRAELLSTLFFCLVMIHYQLAAQTVSPSSNRHMTLAVVFYGASMLSKELGLTALGLIVVYEFVHCSWLLQGHPTRLNTKLAVNQAIFRVALMSLTALIYLLIRSVLSRDPFAPGALVFRAVENPVAFASFHERFLTIPWIHVLYAKLLVWPFDLCVDYSFECIPLIRSFSDPRNVASFCFYVFIGVGGLSILRRFLFDKSESKEDNDQKSFEFLSLCWLIIPFLPASHVFVNVGTLIAERLLYLPSIGFCYLIAYGLVRLSRRFHAAAIRMPSQGGMSSHKVSVGTLVAVGLVALYVHGARLRNLDWQDEEVLFVRALEVCPRSVKVLQNVGILHRRYRDWDRALEFFAEAQRIDPSFCEPDYWRGVTLLEKNQLQAAVDTLDLAVNCSYVAVKAATALVIIFDDLSKQNPDHPMISLNYAKILARIGRVDEAVERFTKVLKVFVDANEPQLAIEAFDKIRLFLEPARREPAVGKSLCRVYEILGDLYMAAQQNVSALPMLEQTYLCNPNGRQFFELYVQTLRLAVDRHANDASLQYRWGLVLSHLGKLSEAVQYLLTSALNHRTAKHYDVALESALAAFDVDPSNCDVRTLLALTFVDLRRLSDALPHLNWILSYSSRCSDAHKSRAASLKMALYL